MSGNDIGWAVKQLKGGQRVTRPWMQEQGTWLVIYDNNSGLGPMIGEADANIAQVKPAAIEDADLLAEDWALFEDLLP